MSSQELYDVAIVGYGPVGATFANLLSNYGLKIAVVEQAADIYDKPRAITIDHEVLRVFQACGLAATMEKGIAPHPGTHYLGVDREVIKIFDPMPPPYPLGWVPTATMVQPDVERALRDQLARYHRADVFLSARATGFVQDSEGVSLTIEKAGISHTLRARYLVACDGANSFVRKQLGIRLDDLAFDEWWMVVDALSSDLAKRQDKCFQYCWPSRPGTYLPGPGALRRWEIKLLPGETPADFESNDNIIKVLQGFTDTSDLTIWRSAVYRFHALLAQRWRDGRILLMGDAAHQTPPFLGQGLSAGVRDAFNLAWKLAFVLRGEGGDALLDTYEIERKPHVSAVVATAKAFGKIIGELDVAAARARDARLQAELRAGTAETIRQKFIPDLTSGLIAADAPLAGSLFVQPRIVRPDGGVVRLDDVLPPGFVIVAASSAPLKWLAEQARRDWLEHGGAFVVVGDKTPAEATDGVITLIEEGHLLADWLRSRDVDVVIVRPDRYVFGAASSAGQLNELVECCLSSLAVKEDGMTPSIA
ncbi:bifunctional 3-(3-hydroxy-phenyl)propionate/3-hydroxycinnamic acid hydroxylase [Microbacteriaceae bacterium K1510]|nr:bifunctional 3-(3-hydroxy-phenyl)propionate/3-hydroxycinnamic acid hydroxylase [Microbacteriaceae bacterium K1510]